MAAEAVNAEEQPAWKRDLIEAHRAATRRERLLYVALAVCLALVLGFAKVGNMRTANDADMARVTR